MRAKATKKYSTLRARMIKAGTTLRRFALENGYNPGTVYAAAKGQRYGIISARIINELGKFNQ